MANDNHASFSIIGFTVCLGAAAIIATLVYIGGIFGNGNEFLIETCYDKPVNGLSVGSPVSFRGVKVGEVRKIGFIGNEYSDIKKHADESRIYVLMAIKPESIGFVGAIDEDDANAFIRNAVVQRGLRATVALSGITGLSRIECDYHDELPPYDEISWKPAHAFVPPKESLLDSFSVSATKVMNQINRMDLSAAWSNVSTAVESLAKASESVRVMVETRQGEFDQLMANMLETAQSTREFLDTVRRNPSLLVREREFEPLRETER